MTDPNRSPSPAEAAFNVGVKIASLPVHLARFAVGQVGQAVGGSMRLLGVRSPEAAAWQPGQPAGIEFAKNIDVPPEPGAVRMECTDYGTSRAETWEVADVEALKNTPKPEWATVRWVNVWGLHPYAINELRKLYGFHTLTAEDILHVPQRPRFEGFEEHLYVVTRMITLGPAKEGKGLSQHLFAEQVSMLLFPGLVLTFQERPGDVWESLRRRLAAEDTRVRQRDADFLLYAQLDAIVDHIFPVLEHYGDVLEDLEEEVMQDPTPRSLHRIQAIRRELSTLRRVLWPTREAVDLLMRSERPALIQDSTQVYLRDVYSHSVQCVDLIETYRDSCAALTDLYMSAVSNRMNEIMKVLTIMATLFIPITFLAGVYGMNFQYIPELSWKPAYATFWGLCLAITAGLLYFFRRRGWI